MPLSASAKLGPYEILSALGAGGMGEVYKARDTRLDRTVAIKVLPEHIAGREDLRARFEREARAVASLNHPHICVLYDIGNEEGVGGYMVMEYLEGETLEACIERGALPLQGALRYALQIADALDRAHRAGVTHRDIKPGNIIITRDGVKVLDFGLAKSTAKPGPTDATIVKSLTTEGTVLGTPQYMSPEQFEGKEADTSSDIWAFGAVLYEMVTGRKAFEGKSYSSLLGAILSAEPGPMSVKPFTPAWLERLVRRCLAKDSERRYHSMRDIFLDLETPPIEIAATRSNRWPWAIAAIALVIGALIGWVVKSPRQMATPEPVFQTQLNPPEGGQFDLANGFAISPDGRSLAFAATSQGKSGVWIRPMEGTAARLLAGTERALSPFWSPDGRSLAYGASGKLWRIEAAGGSPFALCETNIVTGGDWSPSGVIVFATGPVGLRRVPASGGTPEPLITIQANRGESFHRWPQLLPGGRILFLVSGNPEQAGIYATKSPVPLRGPLGANVEERVRLVATNSNGLYAAGHLLWLRGSTLVAQSFDPELLRLSGEPKPIADPVGIGAFARMAATATSSGLLVYGRTSAFQLSWLNRAGGAVDSDNGRFGQPGSYSMFRLSPDGGRVVVSRESGSGGDLWTAEVERGGWGRLTFLPGQAQYPVWSPDGRQVLFRAGSPLNLFRKVASGAGTEQRVTESPSTQWPTDWSRDGRLIMYWEQTPETKRDLWVLPVTPEGKPEGKARPYLRTPFNEYWARFSPQPSPRWVAYTSDESGRNEVYVLAFPEPRAKFQISTGGGSHPDWSRDGRELYYVSAEGKLMVTSLTLGADSVVPSAARELFVVSVGMPGQPYAVAPDGKRFLVLTPTGGSQPLEVVVNWPALLKKGSGPE